MSEYMRPMGGSDLLEIGLHQRLDLSAHDTNLILSRCLEEYIVQNKKNILWQHLNCDEPLTNGMSNKFFTRAIDAFVYVSHWQYEKYRYIYRCPTENAFVIKNAIEPINFTERPVGEKIKLIYTSAPFRGLDVLLDAFEFMKRDDVELHIYSSTLVYGSDYNDAYYKSFEPLFERAKNMPGVIYHGYAINKEVRDALSRADIFAYPSTFEETCCLAMVEAGAAGCRMVVTNLGALPETGSEFARYVPIVANREMLVRKYAAALSEECDLIGAFRNSDKSKVQSDFYNQNYSWDNQLQYWNKLLSLLNA